MLLAFERNPEDGKTEEHFFLVDVVAVPFEYEYGATVANGTTVAVDSITTALTDSLELATFAWATERAPAADVAAAVSVWTRISLCLKENIEQNLRR